MEKNISRRNFYRKAPWLRRALVAATRLWVKCPLHLKEKEKAATDKLNIAGIGVGGRGGGVIRGEYREHCGLV